MLLNRHLCLLYLLAIARGSTISKGLRKEKLSHDILYDFPEDRFDSTVDLKLNTEKKQNLVKSLPRIQYIDYIPEKNYKIIGETSSTISGEDFGYEHIKINDLIGKFNDDKENNDLNTLTAEKQTEKKLKFVKKQQKNEAKQKAKRRRSKFFHFDKKNKYADTTFATTPNFIDVDNIIKPDYISSIHKPNEKYKSLKERLVIPKVSQRSRGKYVASSELDKYEDHVNSVHGFASEESVKYSMNFNDDYIDYELINPSTDNRNRWKRSRIQHRIKKSRFAKPKRSANSSVYFTSIFNISSENSDKKSVEYFSTVNASNESLTANSLTDYTVTPMNVRITKQKTENKDSQNNLLFDKTNEISMNVFTPSANTNSEVLSNLTTIQYKTIQDPAQLQSIIVIKTSPKESLLDSIKLYNRNAKLNSNTNLVRIALTTPKVFMKTDTKKIKEKVIMFPVIEKNYTCNDSNDKLNYNSPSINKKEYTNIEKNTAETKGTDTENIDECDEVKITKRNHAAITHFVKARSVKESTEKTVNKIKGELSKMYHKIKKPKAKTTTTHATKTAKSPAKHPKVKHSNEHAPNYGDDEDDNFIALDLFSDKSLYETDALPYKNSDPVTISTVTTNIDAYSINENGSITVPKSREKTNEGITMDDYVSGYKYYLENQREETKNEKKFSNLVKYQAHRHHNVDDIGKFILDKIPRPDQNPRKKRCDVFTKDRRNNNEIEKELKSNTDNYFYSLSPANKKRRSIFKIMHSPKKIQDSRTLSTEYSNFEAELSEILRSGPDIKNIHVTNAETTAKGKVTKKKQRKNKVVIVQQNQTKKKATTTKMFHKLFGIKIGQTVGVENDFPRQSEIIFTNLNENNSLKYGMNMTENSKILYEPLIDKFKIKPSDLESQLLFVRLPTKGIAYNTSENESYKKFYQPENEITEIINQPGTNLKEIVKYDDSELVEPFKFEESLQIGTFSPIKDNDSVYDIPEFSNVAFFNQNSSDEEIESTTLHNNKMKKLMEKLNFRRCSSRNVKSITPLPKESGENEEIAIRKSDNTSLKRKPVSFLSLFKSKPQISSKVTDFMTHNLYQLESELNTLTKSHSTTTQRIPTIFLENTVYKPTTQKTFNSVGNPNFFKNIFLVGNFKELFEMPSPITNNIYDSVTEKITAMEVKNSKFSNTLNHTECTQAFTNKLKDFLKNSQKMESSADLIKLELENVSTPFSNLVQLEVMENELAKMKENIHCNEKEDQNYNFNGESQKNKLFKELDLKKNYFPNEGDAAKTEFTDPKKANVSNYTSKSLFNLDAFLSNSNLDLLEKKFFVTKSIKMQQKQNEQKFKFKNKYNLCKNDNIEINTETFPGQTSLRTDLKMRNYSKKPHYVEIENQKISIDQQRQGTQKFSNIPKRTTPNFQVVPLNVPCKKSTMRGKRYFFNVKNSEKRLSHPIILNGKTVKLYGTKLDVISVTNTTDVGRDKRNNKSGNKIYEDYEKEISSETKTTQENKKVKEFEDGKNIAKNKRFIKLFRTKPRCSKTMGNASVSQEKKPSSSSIKHFWYKQIKEKSIPMQEEPSITEKVFSETYSTTIIKTNPYQVLNEQSSTEINPLNEKFLLSEETTTKPSDLNIYENILIKVTKSNLKSATSANGNTLIALNFEKFLQDNNVNLEDIVKPVPPEVLESEINNFLKSLPGSNQKSTTTLENFITKILQNLQNSLNYKNSDSAADFTKKLGNISKMKLIAQNKLNPAKAVNENTLTIKQIEDYSASIQTELFPFSNKESIKLTSPIEPLATNEKSLYKKLAVIENLLKMDLTSIEPEIDSRTTQISIDNIAERVNKYNELFVKKQSSTKMASHEVVDRDALYFCSKDTNTESPDPPSSSLPTITYKEFIKNNKNKGMKEAEKKFKGVQECDNTYNKQFVKKHSHTKMASHEVLETGGMYYDLNETNNENLDPQSNPLSTITYEEFAENNINKGKKEEEKKFYFVQECDNKYNELVKNHSSTKRASHEIIDTDGLYYGLKKTNTKNPDQPYSSLPTIIYEEFIDNNKNEGTKGEKKFKAVQGNKQFVNYDIVENYNDINDYLEFDHDKRSAFTFTQTKNINLDYDYDNDMIQNETVNEYLKSFLEGKELSHLKECRYKHQNVDYMFSDHFTGRSKPTHNRLFWGNTTNKKTTPVNRESTTKEPAKKKQEPPIILRKSYQYQCEIVFPTEHVMPTSQDFIETGTYPTLHTKDFPMMQLFAPDNSYPTTTESPYNSKSPEFCMKTSEAKDTIPFTTPFFIQNSQQSTRTTTPNARLILTIAEVVQAIENITRPNAIIYIDLPTFYVPDPTVAYEIQKPKYVNSFWSRHRHTTGDDVTAVSSLTDLSNLTDNGFFALWKKCAFHRHRTTCLTDMSNLTDWATDMSNLTECKLRANANKVFSLDGVGTEAGLRNNTGIGHGYDEFNIYNENVMERIAKRSLINEKENKRMKTASIVYDLRTTRKSQLHNLVHRISGTFRKSNHSKSTLRRAKNVKSESTTPLSTQTEKRTKLAANAVASVATRNMSLSTENVLRVNQVTSVPLTRRRTKKCHTLDQDEQCIEKRLISRNGLKKIQSKLKLFSHPSASKKSTTPQTTTQATQDTSTMSMPTASHRYNEDYEIADLHEIITGITYYDTQHPQNAQNEITPMKHDSTENIVLNTEDETENVAYNPITTIVHLVCDPSNSIDNFVYDTISPNANEVTNGTNAIESAEYGATEPFYNFVYNATVIKSTTENARTTLDDDSTVVFEDLYDFEMLDDMGVNRFENGEENGEFNPRYDGSNFGGMNADLRKWDENDFGSVDGKIHKGMNTGLQENHGLELEKPTIQNLWKSVRVITEDNKKVSDLAKRKTITHKLGDKKQCLLKTKRRKRLQTCNREFTARNVASLEVVVDFVKTHNSKHQSTVPIDCTTQTILNAIQIHISPPNYENGKRSINSVSRKVFSAKLSNPVDIIYSIQSLKPTQATLIDIKPKGYRVMDEKGSHYYEQMSSKQTTPHSNFLLRLINDWEKNKYYKLPKQLRHTTLHESQDYIEDRQPIPQLAGIQSHTNEKIKNNKTVKRSIRKIFRKIFGNDHVCSCRCHANRVMCKSCAASTEVINELMFEFQNIAKYMSEHCTEIQTFFWMNPTDGKKLRGLVNDINKSMNEYFTRVKGKCKGQNCNNLCMERKRYYRKKRSNQESIKGASLKEQIIGVKRLVRRVRHFQCGAWCAECIEKNKQFNELFNKCVILRNYQNDDKRNPKSTSLVRTKNLNYPNILFDINKNLGTRMINSRSERGQVKNLSTKQVDNCVYNIKGVDVKIISLDPKCDHAEIKRCENDDMLIVSKANEEISKNYSVRNCNSLKKSVTNIKKYLLKYHNCECHTPKTVKAKAKVSDVQTRQTEKSKKTEGKEENECEEMVKSKKTTKETKTTTETKSRIEGHCNCTKVITCHILTGDHYNTQDKMCDSVKLIDYDTATQPMWLPTKNNLSKRQTNSKYENVMESPLITDSGGRFWFDYLKKGTKYRHVRHTKHNKSHSKFLNLLRKYKRQTKIHKKTCAHEILKDGLLQKIHRRVHGKYCKMNNNDNINQSKVIKKIEKIGPERKPYKFVQSAKLSTTGNSLKMAKIQNSSKDLTKKMESHQPESINKPDVQYKTYNNFNLTASNSFVNKTVTELKNKDFETNDLLNNIATTIKSLESELRKVKSNKTRNKEPNTMTKNNNLIAESKKLWVNENDTNSSHDNLTTTIQILEDLLKQKTNMKSENDKPYAGKASSYNSSDRKADLINKKNKLVTELANEIFKILQQRGNISTIKDTNNNQLNNKTQMLENLQPLNGKNKFLKTPGDQQYFKYSNIFHIENSTLESNNSASIETKNGSEAFKVNDHIEKIPKCTKTLRNYTEHEEFNSPNKIGSLPKQIKYFSNTNKHRKNEHAQNKIQKLPNPSKLPNTSNIGIAKKDPKLKSQSVKVSTNITESVKHDVGDISTKHVIANENSSKARSRTSAEYEKVNIRNGNMITPKYRTETEFHKFDDIAAPVTAIILDEEDDMTHKPITNNKNKEQFCQNLDILNSLPLNENSNYVLSHSKENSLNSANIVYITERNKFTKTRLEETQKPQSHKNVIIVEIKQHNHENNEKVGNIFQNEFNSALAYPGLQSLVDDNQFAPKSKAITQEHNSENTTRYCESSGRNTIKKVRDNTFKPTCNSIDDSNKNKGRMKKDALRNNTISVWIDDVHMNCILCNFHGKQFRNSKVKDASEEIDDKSNINKQVKTMQEPHKNSNHSHIETEQEADYNLEYTDNDQESGDGTSEHRSTEITQETHNKPNKNTTERDPETKPTTTEAILSTKQVKNTMDVITEIEQETEMDIKKNTEPVPQRKGTTDISKETVPVTEMKKHKITEAIMETETTKVRAKEMPKNTEITTSKTTERPYKTDNQKHPSTDYDDEINDATDYETDLIAYGGAYPKIQTEIEIESTTKSSTSKTFRAENPKATKPRKRTNKKKWAQILKIIEKKLWPIPEINTSSVRPRIRKFISKRHPHHTTKFQGAVTRRCPKKYYKFTKSHSTLKVESENVNNNTGLIVNEAHQNTTTKTYTTMKKDKEICDPADPKNTCICNLEDIVDKLMECYHHLKPDEFEHYIGNMTCHQYIHMPKQFVILHEKKNRKHRSENSHVKDRKKRLEIIKRKIKNGAQHVNEFLLKPMHRIHNKKLEDIYERENDKYKWNWIRNKRSNVVEKIKDDHRSRRTTKIDLSVVDKGLRNLPPFELQKDETYVLLGDITSLSCAPSGVSGRTESWSAERNMLQLANVVDEGATVTVRDVQLENMGVYNCSRNGVVVRSHHLTVVAVPRYDLVFLLLYDAAEGCDVEDLRAVHSGLPHAIEDAVCGHGRACHASVEEPVCLSLKEERRIRATGVLTLATQEAKCNARCASVLQASMAALCSTGVPSVLDNSVVLSSEGGNRTLNPTDLTEDTDKWHIAHSLPKKEQAGIHYHRLASHMSTGELNLVLTCEAGFYLLPRQKICMACSMGHYSRAGSTSCRRCAAGHTTDHPGAAHCRRKHGAPRSHHAKPGVQISRYQRWTETDSMLAVGALVVGAIVAYALAMLAVTLCWRRGVSSTTSTLPELRSRPWLMERRKRAMSPSRVILGQSEVRDASCQYTPAMEEEDMLEYPEESEDERPPLPPIDFEF